MNGINLRAILVATDLRPGCDPAVAGAASLAAATGAALHVVHAIGLSTVAYAGAGSAVGVQSRLHNARKSLAVQIERRVPAGATPASQVIRDGAAHLVILQRAREIDADLIVLGPHRERAFHGPILGSTADRLLRTSEIPVLILAEPLHLPLRTLVVPIDLSDPARGALDEAIRWGIRLGASAGPSGRTAVQVMHVIPRLYEAYEFPFDRTVVAPQMEREIADSLARNAEGAKLEVGERIVWGNAPADEIVRHVESESTDLLVMGTHGYGALGRALIGSITSAVARAAPCPLLIVPPAMWTEDVPPDSIPVEIEVSEPRVPAG
jgi:universal stress protein E